MECYHPPASQNTGIWYDQHAATAIVWTRHIATARRCLHSGSPTLRPDCPISMACIAYIACTTLNSLAHMAGRRGDGLPHYMYSTATLYASAKMSLMRQIPSFEQIAVIRHLKQRNSSRFQHPGPGVIPKASDMSHTRPLEQPGDLYEDSDSDSPTICYPHIATHCILTRLLRLH